MLLQKHIIRPISLHHKYIITAATNLTNKYIKTKTNTSTHH